MKFSFTKKSNVPKHKKDGRIDPHRFWVLFMMTFVAIVIIEIVYFTYFFVLTSRKLDTPVEAKFDTNERQVQKIEKSIQKTEEAVSAREGLAPTSQNTTPIVQ